MAKRTLIYIVFLFPFLGLSQNIDSYKDSINRMILANDSINPSRDYYVYNEGDDRSKPGKADVCGPDPDGYYMTYGFHRPKSGFPPCNLIQEGRD